MTVPSATNEHSSVVEIQLVADGQSIPVAQLGPDFLIVGQGTELEPGPATINMVVDDRSFTWKVVLPDGMAPTSSRVRIAQQNAPVRV